MMHTGGTVNRNHTFALALALAAAGSFSLIQFAQTTQAPTTPTSTQPGLNNATGAASSSLQSTEGTLNPEQQALLKAPEVQAYLQREADKAAMQAYFNSDPNNPDTAKAMWDYIERLEAQGSVMGFEALHLKMAWLQKNSANEAAFKERADALVAHYREHASASAALNNPENTPQFKTYKAEEKAIVAEVNAMSQIPNGLSRQAYLRERLLQARQRAYQQDDSEEDSQNGNKNSQGDNS
ncbi:hypothetical protein L1F30_05060 [Simiduia sp. 21SJ11W-1]|uniref:hypothetical protein n=1 Tax=Simiduia sp. 21SJ11W-1 TaxID=2909669 RepID=UPI0020A0F9C5|nr:hypothetical protein [Simiduia sp. 21SJ11W-1]UTA48917.1 hypothetical protein L1F30_05060 [Simiduia sp. 21SJ11W-1]